jgi:hypothetical protein
MSRTARTRLAALAAACSIGGLVPALVAGHAGAVTTTRAALSNGQLRIEGTSARECA